MTPARAACERWDAASKTLSGKSAVVGGDPYAMTVHLPEAFKLKRAEISNERAEMASQTQTATVRLVPSATKTVDWRMTFE